MPLEITYIPPFVVLFFRSVLIASIDYLKLFLVSLPLRHIRCLLYVISSFQIIFFIMQTDEGFILLSFVSFFAVFFWYYNKSNLQLLKFFGKDPFWSPLLMKCTRARIFLSKFPKFRKPFFCKTPLKAASCQQMARSRCCFSFSFCFAFL